jgi:hypothetical protein
MEATTKLIEPLLHRTEQYCKTGIDLLKLQALDKTADVSSTLLSRVFFSIALMAFAFTLNIAVALYLGDLLGKNYYGFLLIASFYGLIAIALFFVHPKIKARIENSIIKLMLK